VTTRASPRVVRTYPPRKAAAARCLDSFWRAISGRIPTSVPWKTVWKTLIASCPRISGKCCCTTLCARAKASRRNLLNRHPRCRKGTFERDLKWKKIRRRLLASSNSAVFSGRSRSASPCSAPLPRKIELDLAHKDSRSSLRRRFRWFRANLRMA